MGPDAVISTSFAASFGTSCSAFPVCEEVRSQTRSPQLRYIYIYIYMYMYIYMNTVDIHNILGSSTFQNCNIIVYTSSLIMVRALNEGSMLPAHFSFHFHYFQNTYFHIFILPLRTLEFPHFSYFRST